MIRQRKFNGMNELKILDDIRELYNKGINYITKNQHIFTNNTYKNIIILWCVLNKRSYMQISNIENNLFKQYLSLCIIDHSDNYEAFVNIKYVNRHIEPKKEIQDIADKIIKLMSLLDIKIGTDNAYK